MTDTIASSRHLATEDGSEIDPKLPFLEIETKYPDDLLMHSYYLDAATPQPRGQTGSLFFTSGTSGRQKGVIHDYQALLASAHERIGAWSLTSNDVILNQKPGNWMGGIFGIIPSLMTGACL